jgi:transcriptional regulator with XRE-family HTH domain
VVANERLRTAIARRAPTVQDVAARTAVDPKTVERWLRGRTPHSRHRWATAALLKEDEKYLWPEATSSSRAREAELVALYAHRALVPPTLWLDLIQQAERRIDVLVYAALFLHEQNPSLNDLLRAKCLAGLQLRVLLGDPARLYVRERGEEERFGDGIESRCRLASRHYEPPLGVRGAHLRLHRTTLYS